MTVEHDRLLALPVPSRRHTAIAAIALFAFYVFTMSRSLSLYDSPELALVAEQLGLGHPLGQPLHTLLGAIVAHLPGVDPLIALNGLSALAGALTVIPVTSLAGTLLQASREDREGDWRFLAPTVAMVGTLPVLWEPSTRIEVYPLAVFLGLWAAARFASMLADPDGRRVAYLIIGIALGLSASANPVCAVGIGLALLPSLSIGLAQRNLSMQGVGALIGGGLLGLMPYTYVLAVAGREDVVVWGAPTDASSLLHYFTAADFTPKQVDSLSAWSSHVGDLVGWSLSNGLLGLVVWGWVGLTWFRRPAYLGSSVLGVTSLFFVAFVARNGVFAPDVLDYLGYLATPAWLAAGGTGLFVAHLAARRTAFGAGALGLVALLVLVTTPRPYERTRHLDNYTEQLAYEALGAAPHDAILVLEKDHWIGPMWYLQEQLGVRQDVVLVAYGLSASEWYWKHLYRRHPILHGFEIRGEGGRGARVQRFLEANENHPVQIEHFALAQTLGLSTCPGAWFLDATSGCDAEVGPSALASQAAETLERLGEGSPGTDGLIALMTLDRGYDVLAHGFPRAAVQVILAGVPGVPELESIDLSSIPARVAWLSIPPPAYDPPVALGHPAQNLHYAAVIAQAMGAAALAERFQSLSQGFGSVEPKFTGFVLPPANL